MNYFNSPADFRPFAKRKCCVILPVKNRAFQVQHTLPLWLEQTHQKLEIVIVDYNSTDNLLGVVRKIARRYNAPIAMNPVDMESRYENKERISYLLLDDKPDFNMGHACNYGILRSNSDAIIVAGCDAMPVDYFVEFAMNVIDDSTLAVRPSGRVCFPRHFWYRVNGYQEFSKGWGAEDYDYVTRLLKASQGFLLDTALIPSMPHGDEIRTSFYKEKYIRVSNKDNWKLYADYYQQYGFIANYGLPCGRRDAISEQCPTGLFTYVAVSDFPIETDSITKISSMAIKLERENRFIYAYVVPAIPGHEEHMFNHLFNEVQIIKHKTEGKNIWDILADFETHVFEIVDNAKS